MLSESALARCLAHMSIPACWPQAPREPHPAVEPAAQHQAPRQRGASETARVLGALATDTVKRQGEVAQVRPMPVKGGPDGSKTVGLSTVCTHLCLQVTSKRLADGCKARTEDPEAHY